MSMSKMNLTSGGSRSDITVGESLAHFPKAFTKVSGSSPRVALIADAAVVRTYATALKKSLEQSGASVILIPVPSGEGSKTLRQVGRLYHALSKARLDRKSWLIALGGGMVGDMTGFVAATYLRGISFVQIPTTLLAQVDASIGGKTGVDIPEGKNLVGSFYHPRMVWTDPTLLKSLPLAHWRNGLAEVIKCGAIQDAKLFETLEKTMDHLIKGYSSDWTSIIARCVKIKVDIVQKDPRETKGLRALLNFGHSVGHAVEGATHYEEYLHGEAVSIGMFVAGYLSQTLLDLEPIDRIRLGTLLTKAGLPARVAKPILRARLLEFLARDKKAENDSVKFVLLKKIGEAVSGQEVPLDVLDPALAFSGL